MGDSLIKLKGYKVMPKNSDKSNIMKILFPKKQLNEKIAKNVETTTETKTDEEILTTIQNSDSKELANDFVAIDDILLVRDPMDVDSQLDNILNEDEDNSWTTELPFTMETTEKPLKELTAAERLKIASKRRMMNKFAKMEMSLKQRELVKREDTPSDTAKAESETISATLDNKVTTTESSKTTENLTENPLTTKKNEGSSLFKKNNV